MKTMTRFVFLTFALLFSFSICLFAQSKKATEEDSFKAPYQGFSVHINLSDRARKALTERHETIVVFGYFHGDPREGTPDRFLNSVGFIELKDFKLEVLPGEEARFAGFSLEKDALRWIDHNGLQLNINLASGRKSSRWNLISCDFFDGPYSEIDGKVKSLDCSLIGERHP
jgi:hypothetical protein